MTRKQMAALLLAPKLTTDQIAGFGMSLLAMAASRQGDTLTESLDAWRDLYTRLSPMVEEAIRANWDQHRS